MKVTKTGNDKSTGVRDSKGSEEREAMRRGKMRRGESK